MSAPDDEPRCESQGCHCSPALPCDESGCDGEQFFDGSMTHCSMCQREIGEMLAAAS